MMSTENENAKEPAVNVDSKKRKGSANSGKKKSPREKDKTLTVNGHLLKLTNQEKVYWPKEGYTKGDVLAYYN